MKFYELNYLIVKFDILPYQGLVEFLGLPPRAYKSTTIWAVVQGKIPKEANLPKTSVETYEYGIEMRPF